VVSIFPAITKAAAYDPVKDFKPISVIGVNPQALVVNAKLPVGNVAAFIAYVKNAAATASLCGRRWPGQPEQSAHGAVPQAGRLEMTSVSYRGTAPAMTDLIAGHIPTMFVPLSEALPQAQAGNIRMLGVSSASAPGRPRKCRPSPNPDFPAFRARAGTACCARRHARRHRQTGSRPNSPCRQGTEIHRAARPGGVDPLDRAPLRPRGSSPPTWHSGGTP